MHCLPFTRLENQKGQHSPTSAKDRLCQLWYSSNSWRFGTKICAIATFAVSVINLSVFGWAAMHYGVKGGQQILYEGDCAVAAKLNTYAHLIINALSTILLGSCNYCMQCLSAPTRKELDKAHSKGKSLDIGILSPRNLANIPAKKVVLWCALGISSIPVHLL
jgi:hypothetical protein